MIGSLLWGVAMALSMLAALGRANAWIDGRIVGLLLIYFVGAALAFTPAVLVTYRLADGRRADTRFAAAFVCLAVATIGITSLIYALDHLGSDLGWADLAAGLVGVFHAAVSIAVAEAEFAALGVRLYVPEGLVVLAIASLWLARRRR
jgi:hypothetical protein